jgi:hypothetical protein
MALKFKKVARKALGGDEKGTTRYYAAVKSVDCLLAGNYPARYAAKRFVRGAGNNR